MRSGLPGSRRAPTTSPPKRSSGEASPSACETRCSTFRVTRTAARHAIRVFRHVSRIRHRIIFSLRKQETRTAPSPLVKGLTALRQSNSNSLFVFRHRRGAGNALVNSRCTNDTHESWIRERVIKQRKKQRLRRARWIDSTAVSRRGRHRCHIFSRKRSIRSDELRVLRRKCLVHR